MNQFEQAKVQSALVKIQQVRKDLDDKKVSNHLLLNYAITELQEVLQNPQGLSEVDVDTPGAVY
jgi:hypothetical protein